MIIKKSVLWTFLIIVAIVLFFVLFNPFKSSSGTSFDVTPFVNNPTLYPSIGPDSAKDVVIEFADFQCPICGLSSGLPSWSSQYSTNPGYNVAGKLEQAAQMGKIKFIFVTMDFLDVPKGTTAGSAYAAEAGFCANDQGQFWAMHDAIFTNQATPQQEGTQFTRAQLKSMAAQISGLNQSQFVSCLDSDKYLSTVQRANNQAFSSGIQGTPSIVINGKLLSDYSKAPSLLGL